MHDQRRRDEPLAPLAARADPPNVQPKLTSRQPSQKRHKSYAQPSTGAVSVTVRSIPRANLK
jgi:hypothetical protein